MSAEERDILGRRGTGVANWLAPFLPFRRVEDGASVVGTTPDGRETLELKSVASPVGYSLPDGLRSNPKAGAVWGSVWLFYLVPAFGDAVGDHHSAVRQILGVALLAGFIALYVVTLLVGWDAGAGREAAPMHGWNARAKPLGVKLALVLVALALACTLVVGDEGAATIVFLAPIAATILPARQARWAILGAVAAVTTASLLVPSPSDSETDLGGLVSTGFATLMAGAITLGIRRMRMVMWELHHARMDVERLATATERVRIARDLHDVLGHSLTVISMRSQLASKLVDRGEMEKAGAEIKAVEELSRTAMADVREAVAGYRVRPFAAELAAAEATLGGAGLLVEVERSTQELPDDGEEALAFVMREGVTNVLRHSRAARCAIRVRHTPTAVIVELADDGRGIGTPLHVVGTTPIDGADEGCNGLRGLAERLAAVGGRLSAGDAPAGGFVLRAELAR